MQECSNESFFLSIEMQQSVCKGTHTHADTDVRQRAAAQLRPPTQDWTTGAGGRGSAKSSIGVKAALGDCISLRAAHLSSCSPRAAGGPDLSAGGKNHRERLSRQQSGGAPVQNIMLTRL